MDRDEINVLLEELADALTNREVRGEMLIVGGAAMALVYSERRSTADLDAVFEPKAVMYEAAAEIAVRRGLDVDWLNDAVKAYVPGPDRNALVFFDRPGLVVRIASVRFLLAMKLLASRVERDEDDVRVLLTLSGITSVDEVLALVTDLYPCSIVPPRAEYLVRELLDADG